MYDVDAEYDKVREMTLFEGLGYLMHLHDRYWRCEDSKGNPVLLEHQKSENRILIFRFIGERTV